MKKLKTISSILVLLVVVLLITGCDDNNNKVISNGKKVNTSKMEHKHCTGDGNMENGEVTLEYDIYYTDERLNIVKSVTTIKSDSSSVLDTYEKAYKDIYKNYEGLEYYDTSVERSDNGLVNTITINYDEIDIDKLISIEGEEDNIFENKVPKVKKWLELGKKFGTKCKLVEE